MEEEFDVGDEVVITEKFPDYMYGAKISGRKGTVTRVRKDERGFPVYYVVSFASPTRRASITDNATNILARGASYSQLTVIAYSSELRRVN